MAQGRTPIEQVWTTKGNLPNNAIVATADGKYPALDGSLITGIAGAGDMNASVYDPTTIQADAFARANHTGTQTAATISDFDTEVSNNTTVASKADQATTYTIGQVDDMLTYYPLAADTYTKSQVDTNIAANFTTADRTKLDGIATGAEVNTIESIVEAGMTDDTVVLNVVSVSQANYDAGTKIGTTLYIIT